MVSPRDQNALYSCVSAAYGLSRAEEAAAVLLLVDFEADWAVLAERVINLPLLVATNVDRVAEGAITAGLGVIRLDHPEMTIPDRLTHAILEAVAAEWISPGSAVAAVYSSFDSESIDTISLIRLNERLGKLTARDLRMLDTKVPLETLKFVVDLAVEIGREGREGKPVGTMFVVGDHRKVMDESRPGGFDFVKGYPRRERNLADFRVREGIKEIAQLDGMFVVAADGTIEASCRIIDTAPVELTLTTGLGSRHFAAAAISKNTHAVSVTVSETNGTVRLFQNGEVILRIEPFTRAMKWKSFQAESTAD